METDKKFKDNLGITKEYNKENRVELWDSPKAKSDYKEKKFNNNKTIVDPITKKVLHKSQNAAKKKYHMKNKEGKNISKKWAKHSTEVDHIISIKAAHKLVKDNPFLSDDDLKEIINNEKNLRLSSKHDNASKGDKSYLEEIFDKNNDLSIKEKGEIFKDWLSAGTTIQTQFAIRTVQNTGKLILTQVDYELLCQSARQAGNAALVASTTATIHNIAMVAEGQKDINEAAKDILTITGSTAVSAGLKEYLTGKVFSQIDKLGEESSIVFLKNNICRFASEISLAIEGSKLFYKFIDDQISLEDCISQISITVAGNAAFVLGSTLAPPLGGIAAQMIVEFVCDSIYSEIKAIRAINKNNKKKCRMISEIATEAMFEMELHRDCLRKNMEELFEKWDKDIEEGFELVKQGSINNDVTEISKGYDRILSLFNRNVSFSSTEEFEYFLLSGQELIF